MESTAIEVEKFTISPWGTPRSTYPNFHTYPPRSHVYPYLPQDHELSSKTLISLTLTHLKAFSGF